MKKQPESERNQTSEISLGKLPAEMCERGSSHVHCRLNLLLLFLLPSQSWPGGCHQRRSGGRRDRGAAGVVRPTEHTLWLTVHEDGVDNVDTRRVLAWSNCEGRREGGREGGREGVREGGREGGRE